MPGYDPMHKDRRLWNNPDNVLNESLAVTMMMHKNLQYIDSCNAIIRKDYNKLIGKVKIISGGAVIDGPTYAGFVGPGMLTAAAVGIHGCASIPTSDSIFEIIDYISKNQKQADGILLLVHDCTEYSLHFSLAMKKAKEKGIPIKMILIRDEATNNKLTKRPLSPRSPSGLLFICKIAGAMSEEGKDLNEIYNVCNNIVQNDLTFSVGVYIEPNLLDSYEIKITRGDRLSDRNIKCYPVEESSTKKVIEHIINDLILANDSEIFPSGSKLAIMLNYFGGFCELEANIVIKELMQQCKKINLEIIIIYSGSFYTSVEVYGFHLSILNLSSDILISQYLNAPTLAYSWPKPVILGKITQTKVPYSQPKSNIPENNSQAKVNNNNYEKEEPDLYKDLDYNKIKHSEMEESPVFEETFESEVLLMAIEYACEALIACAPKIDMLDKPLNDEGRKCGTRLSKIADAIKSAIHLKQIFGPNLSNIIFEVAGIIKKNIHDPQAVLYTRFLNTVGQAITYQENLEACDWLDAFVEATRSVDDVIKGTKFSDTLYAAKAAFCDAYANEENINVIQALGQAVNAAQEQTAHVIPESGKIPENVLNEKDSGFIGLAGAHAIGVWMRGAYEGIKLKYSSQKSRKRERHSDFSSDNLVAEKRPKVSDEVDLT